MLAADRRALVKAKESKCEARSSSYAGYIATSVSVILVVIVVTITGCGSNEEPRTSFSAVELHRHVLSLDQGSSIAEVESELGVPLARSGSDDRTELNYGRWQLVFANDHLSQRSIVRAPKATQPVRPSAHRSATVMTLKLGASIHYVEERLGPPEAIYETLEEDPEPVKVLRYSPWQLTFIQDQLSQRSQ